MKISKIIIIAVISVLLGLESISFSKTQSTLDLDVLKKRIQLSELARSELISRSKGKARITLKNKKRIKFDEKYQELKLRYGQKVTPLVGEGKWEVEWQHKDGKKRYDTLMKKSNKNSFTINQNIRVASNSEKLLCYDVLDERAYVNRPARPITSPTSLLTRFDINYFYDNAISGINGTVRDYITMMQKKGNYPEIIKSQNNNQKTIFVKYTIDKPVEDKVHKVVRIFEFCPEKSYSLINYEVYNNFETDFEEMKLVYNFKGEYEESKNYSGIWILTKSTIYALNNFIEETLVCEFEDVKIGVEIPDETFTFDGLGVPPGTPVYDRSLVSIPHSLHIYNWRV